MEIDINRQPQPYVIYERLFVNQTVRQYLSFKINQGFGYLLRRIYVKFPESAEFINAVTPLQLIVFPVIPIDVELFDNANFKARQTFPVPFTCFSGHGNANIRQKINTRIPGFAAAAADFQNGVMDNPQIVEFTYGQPKTSTVLNYFYVNGDVIQLQITGNEIINEGVQCPIACDIALQGYYMLDKKLDYWK